LCLLSLDKDDPLALPAFAPNPAADVRTLEASARAYAKELKDAGDVDGRTRLEAERDELSDRLLLADMVPKAEAEVARLKALKLVAACLPDTTTNLITKLGNDIADTLITPKIRDQFQSEIVGLAANKVRVEIVRSGGSTALPIRVASSATPMSGCMRSGEGAFSWHGRISTELATAAINPRWSSTIRHPRPSLARRRSAHPEAANRQIIVFCTTCSSMTSKTWPRRPPSPSSS
jgi:hypothetical protein